MTNCETNTINVLVLELFICCSYQFLNYVDGDSVKDTPWKKIKQLSVYVSYGHNYNHKYNHDYNYDDKSDDDNNR